MTAQTLQHEKISHLDLNEFSKVESGTSTQQVVDQMRRERHNCAFVFKDGHLVGIFTERDVLSKVVAAPDVWQQPVDEVMTPTPTTIAFTDTAETALDLMQEGNFRNLPVEDEGSKVRGNVTHYAFIKFLADHYPEEIYNLSPDDGIHDDRYGG